MYTFDKNAFENVVCQMAATLSRHKCVKQKVPQIAPRRNSNCNKGMDEKLLAAHTGWWLADSHHNASVMLKVFLRHDLVSVLTNTLDCNTFRRG